PRVRRAHSTHDAVGILQLLSPFSLPLPPSFAWRLAAFYAALFVALGVQLPFLPLWLAAKGLDAGAIGIALAVPLIRRVCAIPLATRGAGRPARRAAHGDRDCGRDGRARLWRGGDGAGRTRHHHGAGAGVRLLHADHAAGRRLCAAWARPSRARLWSGAALGLRRLHRRQLRGGPPFPPPP